jgi:hypothetical protein
MHSANSARFAALGHTPVRQPPYPPPPTYVWAQQSTGTGNVATPNISQRQIQWFQALRVLDTGYQRGNPGLGVPLGHCIITLNVSGHICVPRAGLNLAPVFRQRLVEAPAFHKHLSLLHIRS